MVPLLFNLLMIQRIHWGPALHLVVSNGHTECLPASPPESQLPLRSLLWTLPVITICAACVIRLALSHHGTRVHTGALAVWSQASPVFVFNVLGAVLSHLAWQQGLRAKGHIVSNYSCNCCWRVMTELIFCPSGKEKNDTNNPNRYCNRKQWI